MRFIRQLKTYFISYYDWNSRRFYFIIYWVALFLYNVGVTGYQYLLRISEEASADRDLFPIYGIGYIIFEVKKGKLLTLLL